MNYSGEPTPATFLADHKSLVDEIVNFVARKHNLSKEDKEDFASELWIKLLADDGAVFRAFKGDASMKTYLRVVIARFFLDYRDKQWGRWRPSKQAKRLGETAVLLERFTHRDGLRFGEAFSKLKHNYGLTISEVRCLDLFKLLPHRSGRYFDSEEVLENHPVQDLNPVEFLINGESQMRLEKAINEVRECLERLSVQDRMVVRMHYEKNMPISQIARTLGLDAKRLYRFIPKILKRMRRLLEDRGVGKDMVEILFR